MIDAETVQVVDQVIRSRRSVRAFLDRPVPAAMVREILDVAARAPSGVNTQPWKVHVLTGPALSSLSQAIVAAFDNPDPADPHVAEFTSYPEEWQSPYVDRRRKLGWELYGLLGIQKGDSARMHAQVRRNYEFFGAPVGLIFTMDRVMAKGSVLDCGMFMQTVMLAARARGLDTCPQAAFNVYHRVITRDLGIPPEQLMMCGMSLGYADPDAPENRLETHRETADSFAVFHHDHPAAG